jgi:ABC-type transport system substrate-binding protein
MTNPQVTPTSRLQDGTKTDAEKQTAADEMQKILLDESPDIITVLSPLTTANKTVKGSRRSRTPSAAAATVYKTSTK